MDREPSAGIAEQTGERPKAFLYFRTGVNEDVTLAAREELKRRGIPFREVDLTKHKLDNEWPELPVISSLAGFRGNLKDKEAVKAVISLIS